MQKRQFFRIVIRASIALIIPILGQLFVSGWDWGLGEFVFAWVFFIILGTTYTYVTNKIAHRGIKIVVGVLVVLLLALVWGMFATG